MTKEIVDGYREKFNILPAKLGGVRRIFRKLTENKRNESQYTVLSRILDKYAIVQELCVTYLSFTCMLCLLYLSNYNTIYIFLVLRAKTLFERQFIIGF